MKKKLPKSATQWKVIRDVSSDELEHQLEWLSERGWDMVAILGPLNGGLVIVAERMLLGAL